jgi:hypothetical protein
MSENTISFKKAAVDSAFKVLWTAILTLIGTAVFAAYKIVTDVNSRWVERSQGAMGALLFVIFVSYLVKRIDDKRKRPILEREKQQREMERLQDEASRVLHDRHIKELKSANAEVFKDLDAKELARSICQENLNNLILAHIDLQKESALTQLFHLGRRSLEDKLTVLIQVVSENDDGLAEAIQAIFNRCGEVVVRPSPWFATIDPVYQKRKNPTTDSRIVLVAKNNGDTEGIPYIFNHHEILKESIAAWDWRTHGDEKFDVVITIYKERAAS